jgi:hypothetical protein
LGAALASVWQAAAAAYASGLDIAESLGMRPLVAHCHLGLAKLYRRTDKRDEAQEHLTIATTMYHEMDIRFWLEKAQAETKEVTAPVGGPLAAFASNFGQSLLGQAIGQAMTGQGVNPSLGTAFKAGTGGMVGNILANPLMPGGPTNLGGKLFGGFLEGLASGLCERFCAPAPAAAESRSSQ